MRLGGLLVGGTAVGADGVVEVADVADGERPVGERPSLLGVLVAFVGAVVALDLEQRVVCREQYRRRLGSHGRQVVDDAIALDLVTDAVVDDHGQEVAVQVAADGHLSCVFLQLGEVHLVDAGREVVLERVQGFGVLAERRLPVRLVGARHVGVVLVEPVGDLLHVVLHAGGRLEEGEVRDLVDVVGLRFVRIVRPRDDRRRRAAVVTPFLLVNLENDATVALAVDDDVSLDVAVDDVVTVPAFFHREGVVKVLDGQFVEVADSALHLGVVDFRLCLLPRIGFLQRLVVSATVLVDRFLEGVASFGEEPL